MRFRTVAAVVAAGALCVGVAVLFVVVFAAVCVRVVPASFGADTGAASDLATPASSFNTKWQLLNTYTCAVKEMDQNLWRNTWVMEFT